MVVGAALLSATGCSTITEVRWRAKFGPEYRSKGGDSPNSTRWTVQTGPQVKFENGWTAGVTYRHRWEDERTDDGVWLEFSFPLYRKSDADRRRRMRAGLEARELDRPGR